MLGSHRLYMGHLTDKLYVVKINSTVRTRDSAWLNKGIHSYHVQCEIY